MSYSLHERLASDTLAVTSLDLCQVRLMDDSRFPWLILVPGVVGISEIHQLSSAQVRQLGEESCRLARVMEGIFQPDKLNVASLGNLVPQLHLHHVARFRDDPCWPGPVWGCGEGRPYPPQEADSLCQRVRAALGAGGA